MEGSRGRGKGGGDLNLPAATANSGSEMRAALGRESKRKKRGMSAEECRDLIAGSDGRFFVSSCTD